MPKLEYFLLCESISVDQETNRVSLFNVLEDLHLAKLPKNGDSKPAFILNQFVAVAVFNREPEDGDQDFEACLKYNLPDGGYEMRLRDGRDVPIACVSWGSGTC